MEIKVVDCPDLFQRLGAHRRHHTPGPESELVDWFLATHPFRVPRGCRATVFREPRLPSGFPDFVLVFWSGRAAERWTKERQLLTDADVRLMQYMVQHGETSVKELESMFQRGVLDRIERLYAAGMIRRVRNAWKPRALSQCFAVREIIAFEAKVSDWSTALDQAFLNTWFASESYVLVPHMPRGERLLKDASKLGIGVWTKASGCCLRPASSSSGLPISYASWLFNEWAWRAEGQTNELSYGNRSDVASETVSGPS